MSTTVNLDKIRSYFGKSVGTLWGDCFVIGFTDDNKYVELSECGEPFVVDVAEFFDMLM